MRHSGRHAYREGRVYGQYVIIASGHKDIAAKSLGIEIWIRKDLLKVFGAIPDLTPDDILTLYADERILILYIAIAHNHINVVVFHALDRDHGSESVRAWWKHFSSLLAKYLTVGAPLIMAGDANGKVGSATSDAIGAHAAEPQNARGKLMHEVCTERGLWVSFFTLP